MEPNEMVNDQISIIDTLRDKSKTTISTSAEKIQQALVDASATIEINRRIDIATKALKKHDDLTKEFNKINRPDLSAFDANQVEVKSYSKQRMDDIRKQKKTLEEFTTAVENALLNNTAEAYEKLSQKLSSGGSQEKAQESKPE